MYECLECNAKFESPNQIPEEIYYGIDSEFNYRSNKKINVCPKCESNDIEQQLDIYDFAGEENE